MKFNNDTPIYLQLISIFKEKILSGEWKAEEKIPSVRDLAVTFSVNPNTIQRALSELENAGLLRSERTLGRFVQSDISSLKKLKNEELDELSKVYIRKMKSFGVDKEQVMQIISDNWEEI